MTIPLPHPTGRHRALLTAGRRRVVLTVGLGAFALLAPLTPGSATSAAAHPTGTRAAPGPAPHAGVPRPVTPAEARTDTLLRSLRHSPARLRGFFRDLPKGGDLHNHLFGAVRTEYLIKLAADDGLCIDTGTMTAVVPPCDTRTRRPAADARTDRAFRAAIRRAWSMQDFPPHRLGHDHFFATFDKFALVAGRHQGKVLAEVADDVAENNQVYLETMVQPAADATDRLADEVGWDGDLARLHRKLLAGGRLDRLVAAAREETDGVDAEFRAAARCDTGRPRPACRPTVRLIYQALRAGSRERVFTQLALGMRLAERDPRFLAVNLVQPEDLPASLRNYRLEMRMLAFLRTRYPHAHVTLHAGELWTGLVKPEDLTFHIGEAVRVAGAERIGHGVDFAFEHDRRDLARTMAAQQIAVEVPFTSNAQILGVRGRAHPFETYRAYGVPTVLATDDPGVSRIDISHEYQYAAVTYGLSYPELKDLARASLQYAFLPGRSIWQGNPTTTGYRPTPACRNETLGDTSPAPRCRHLLTTSPKARVQWHQEAAFTTFEHTGRRN
ncbi:adenosine deaminase [Streptomyces shenzhenensis]|uniref:adenosine deaminase family protein n=1 Tax=Streptomyces shenzhenensis TaxID=943815 RepID=UPI00217DA93D|nr:adenosine deaminase [Streptomyces shenzhenensis]